MLLFGSPRDAGGTKRKNPVVEWLVSVRLAQYTSVSCELRDVQLS